MKKALKCSSSILLTLLMLASMLPAFSLPVFAAAEGETPEGAVLQEPAPEEEAPLPEEEPSPEEEALVEEPPAEELPVEEAPEDEPVPEAATENDPAADAVEPEDETMVEPASSTLPDDSIGKVDTNVLAEMSFNTNTSGIEALIEQDIAPYGTGTTALHTVSELFVGVGWREKLYDGTPAQQTYNNNNGAIFNYEGLDAASLMDAPDNASANANVLNFTNSYSKVTSPGALYADSSAATGTANTAARVLGGEYDFIRSAAFDPNGVGRNTHVAQVSAKVSGAAQSDLYLRVLDLEAMTATVPVSLGALPFRMFASSAGAYLCIEAGDFDGDGLDEFAVYQPLTNTSPKDSRINIYKMETSSSNVNYYSIQNNALSTLTGKIPVPALKKYISVKDEATKCGMVFDGLDTTKTGTAAMRELPVVDMTTSRQSEDFDGGDDLIFTVSYTRDIKNRSTGTKLQFNGLEVGEGTVTSANSDGQSIASRVLAWIDPLGAKAAVKKVNGLQAATSAYTWNWRDYGTTLTGDTANPMYEVGVFAGVGTGDIDNDGADEIIVASYRLTNDLTSSHINSSQIQISIYEMLVTYLEYDHTSNAYKLAQKPNWVFFYNTEWDDAIKLSDGLYNDDLTEPYLTWEPPEVLGFAERGRGYADSVLVNGIVVALDSKTSFGKNGTSIRAYEGYSGYPSGMNSDTLTILQDKDGDAADLMTARYAMPLARMELGGIIPSVTGRVLGEAVAGNFDSNPDGREQVVVTYLTKYPGSNNFNAWAGMMGLLNPEQEAGFTLYTNTNAFFSGNAYVSFQKVSTPITLAAVDIDDDSLIIRYANKRPDYYFSDPKPIMLLQAAPYFEELGEDTGSTTYESFEGSGTSTNHEVSVGAGISVGFEQEINTIAGKIGGFKMMATASVSAGYANESATEITLFNTTTATKEDLIVLSMTPYIRYYYEIYDKDSGRWAEMVVDYPMDTRVTEMAVDTYDAMAEKQGWQLIRGNAMLHTPGDPSTYPSSMAGWNNVSTQWTPTSPAERGSIESSQDSASHGVTWGAGVSTEAELNVFGVVAGVSASVDYTGGYTWTNFSGYTYAATVAAIGSKNVGYSFDWRFGWYKTKLYTEQLDNPVNVVVLGYLTRNVSALPKPPSNLHVKAVTDNSVTMGWSRATGKVTPEYYTLQSLRSGSVYNVGIAAAGQHSLVDTNVTPNTDLEYAVTTSGFVNNRLVSGPRSNSVMALTSDSSKLSFRTHPKDTSIKVGERATMSVTVVNKTDTQDLTYNWQYYDAVDGWESVDGSGNTATMNLGLANISMDKTVYRCEVTSKSGGQNIVAYSNSATLFVSKYSANLYADRYKDGSPSAGAGRITTSTSQGDPLNYSISLNAPSTGGPAPTGTVVALITNTSTNEGHTVKMEYKQTGIRNGRSYMDCAWYPTKPGEYTVTAEYYGDANYNPKTSSSSQPYTAYDKAGVSSLFLFTSYSSIIYGNDARFSLHMRSMDASGTTTSSEVQNSSALTFTVIREGEYDENGNLVQKAGLIAPYSGNTFSFTPDKAGRYYITANYTLGGNTYTTTYTYNVQHAVLSIQANNVTRTLTEVRAMSTSTFNNLCNASADLYYKHPLIDETLAACKATLNTDKGPSDIAVGTYVITPSLEPSASSDLIAKLNEQYRIVYKPASLVIKPDSPVMAKLTFEPASAGGIITAIVDGLPVTSGSQVLAGREAEFTAVPDDDCTLHSWIGATPDPDDPLKATAQVAADGSTVVKALFNKGGSKNMVTGVTIEPSDITLARLENHSLQFTADVSIMGGAERGVTWELLGNTSEYTTISDTGLLKISGYENAEVLTVRAITKGVPAHVATATVNLETQPEVSQMHVLPIRGSSMNDPSVQRGTTQQFHAVVLGCGEFDRTVTWRIDTPRSSGTSINSDGLLTVAPDETATELYVVATSAWVNKLGYNIIVSTKVLLTDEAPGSDRFNILLYTEDLDYDRYYRTGSGVMIIQPMANPGTTVQFKAQMSFTDSYKDSKRVEFSVSGAQQAGTAIDSSTGLLTIDPSETAEVLEISVKWTAMTGTLSDKLYLTINHKRGSIEGVSVNPAKTEVTPGGTATFAASVQATGGAGETVTWHVLGAQSEATGITSGGVLTVGEDEAAPRLLVVATSTQDASQFGMAEVSITGNEKHNGVFSITLSPSTATVRKGESQAFTADVAAEDDADTGVVWELFADGAGGNSSDTTISEDGVLTISENETAETLTVKATSKADDSVYGRAVVTVAAARTLTGVILYPATARLALGDSHLLTLRPFAGDTLPDDAIIEWSVEDNNIAVIMPDSDGRSAQLTGWANGSTTVTVTVILPDTDEEFTATCAVTVHTPIENFTLNKAAHTMAPGEKLGLIPGVSPEGAAIDAGDIHWSTTNSLVAQVNQNGEVTALKPGVATITATTEDQAFTASCVVTVQWVQGSLTASAASLLLEKEGSPATITVTASEGLGQITAKVFKADGKTEFAEGSEVITIDPAGEGAFTVSPLAVGTAYIHFSAANNPGVTAVCRVDVYEKAGPVEGGTVAYAKRHLQTTAAIIYNRNLQRTITLPLQSDGNGSPWLMAGAEYAFTGAGATVVLLEAAYTIEAGSDGQSLELKPKDSLEKLKTGKYTTGIEVTLPGASSPQPLIAGTLTLTVVDSLPKLAATAISVNSFLANRTRAIVITGAEGFSYTLAGNEQKATANKNLEDSWLDVDFTPGSESVTVKAGTSKRSATYYLAVKLDEAVWGDKAVWGTDPVVNVPLKVNVTYTTPALKLASTKVTMYAGLENNSGARLTLTTKAANATLQGIGVNDIQVIPSSDLTGKELKTYKNQDAFKRTSFNLGTGVFTLAPNPEADITAVPKGKVLLGVTVNGGGYVMRLPVTVSVIRPGSAVRLTANTTSVTLNQLLSPAQSHQFELGTNAQGYYVDWNDQVTWKLKRGSKDVTESGELDVIPDGNRFAVTTTRLTEKSATYKLIITKTALYQDAKGRDKDGSITLTIKTVKPSAKVGASLSVKEKADLTTGAYAVLTAKFTNYRNGFVDEPVFEAKTMPKGVTGAITDYFDFEPLDRTGTRWAITPKDVPVTPGTYSITASGTLNTGDPLTIPKAVKFSVAATKPKAALEAKKVTMYSTDQHGTASVGLTLPAGTPPVARVKIKSTAHDKMYDVNLRGDNLIVSFDQDAFSKDKPKSVTLTLEIYLEGNTKAATTVKLGVMVKKFK